MGAVFSKKSGLNMLFVGCRRMIRDEFYSHRGMARSSRRANGDFCQYIRNSKGSEWEIALLYKNDGYWTSQNLIEVCRFRTRNSIAGIIRWRTEGK